MKPHALKTFPSLTAHLSSVDAILTPEGGPSASVCFFPGPANHRASLRPLAPSIPRFNRLPAVGLTARQCSLYAASPKVAWPLCRPGHPAQRRMSPTGLLHLGFLEIRHLLPSQT